MRLSGSRSHQDWVHPRESYPPATCPLAGSFRFVDLPRGLRRSGGQAKTHHDYGKRSTSGFDDRADYPSYEGLAGKRRECSRDSTSRHFSNHGRKTFSGLRQHIRRLGRDYHWSGFAKARNHNSNLLRPSVVCSGLTIQSVSTGLSQHFRLGIQNRYYYSCAETEVLLQGIMHELEEV
jgi:hypothetical protein